MSLSKAEFGLGAVAGTTAFGQYRLPTAAGIGEIDMITGRLTAISRYGSGVSGLGTMAVDLPWVVWEQLDSQTDLLDWSVHAYNVETSESFVLADSGSVPGRVAGPQPILAISNAVAAWTQPIRDRTGTTQAELRLVDLATRRQSTIDTGRISSPVFAGGYLIWAALDSSGGFAFRAVRADRRRRVALPAALTRPGTIGYLSGSEAYLAWSDLSGTDLTTFDFATNSINRYAVHDHRHYLQFLTLAGHYLLWFTGATSAVLDLATAKGFDVDGTVAGTAERIAIAQPTSNRTAKDNNPTTQITNLATVLAPEINTCGR